MEEGLSHEMHMGQCISVCNWLRCPTRSMSAEPLFTNYVSPVEIDGRPASTWLFGVFTRLAQKRFLMLSRPRPWAV